MPFRGGRKSRRGVAASGRVSKGYMASRSYPFAGYQKYASKMKSAAVAKGTFAPRAEKPWPERRPLAKSGSWPQKQQRFRPTYPARFLDGDDDYPAGNE